MNEEKVTITLVPIDLEGAQMLGEKYHVELSSGKEYIAILRNGHELRTEETGDIPEGDEDVHLALPVDHYLEFELQEGLAKQPNGSEEWVPTTGTRKWFKSQIVGLTPA